MKLKINQAIIFSTVIISIISLLAFVVFAAGFDFSVSVNPKSGSVVQGNSINTQVNVTLLHNPTKTVTLSNSGCPSSATCSFSPSSGNPTYTSTFSVATATSTPTGTYPINITGTGGGLTRTTVYTLNVTAPPPVLIPDLIIDSIVFAEYLGNLSQVLVDVNTTVKNIGNGTAGASLTQINYLPSTLNHSTTSLAAGASTKFTRTYNCTSSHTVTATADIANAVSESNELNNDGSAFIDCII